MWRTGGLRGRNLPLPRGLRETRLNSHTAALWERVGTRTAVASSQRRRPHIGMCTSGSDESVMLFERSLKEQRKEGTRSGSNTQARSHPRGGFDGAAGLVGLLIAAEIALLLLPPPVGVEKQARRFLALTAVTTALIAGVVGAGYFGVADLLAGLQKPSQSVFAFFDGGVIFGVPGLILGALVGSILALDYRGQAGRDGGVRDEVLSFESP